MAEKKKTFERVVGDFADQLAVHTFDPKPEWVAVKSAWYVLCRENPIYDSERFTAKQVAAALNDDRIIRWWSKAGFKEWFKNNLEIEQNFEKLMHRWTSCVDCIITSTDPKSFTAKIALGKFLADQTKRSAAIKKEVKILDNTIPDNEEELDELLKQNDRKLKQVK